MSDEEKKDEDKEKSEAFKNRRKTSRRVSKRKSTSKRQSTSRRQSRRQSSRQSRGSRVSVGLKKSKKTTNNATLNSEDVEMSLKESNEFLESPIDLHRDDIQMADIPKLQWTNYQSNPLYLKVTNTTNTVVLNALYPEMYTPTLVGGPLSVPYKFSQLHFHWGEKDEIGSEHKIEGAAYPLEGHMVLYKSEYDNLEAARSHDDGVIILVHMFQTCESSDLTGFTKYLPQVRDPYSQIPITTVSLESFFPQLIEDYVLYFGNMAGCTCNHGILWLISRKTLGITEEELEDFRKINTKPGLPIGNNFRDVKPQLNRNVYIANASEKDRKMVLHPLPQTVKAGGRSGRSSKKSKAGRRESRRASRRGSQRQSKTGRRQSQRKSVSRKKSIRKK